MYGANSGVSEYDPDGLFAEYEQSKKTPAKTITDLPAAPPCHDIIQRVEASSDNPMGLTMETRVTLHMPCLVRLQTKSHGKL